MTRPPSRSRTVPGRPGELPGASHEPAPVDLGSESVAGEEDPGASVETPTSTRSQGPSIPRPPDGTGSSRS
jgi:hypothetical protein